MDSGGVGAGAGCLLFSGSCSEPHLRQPHLVPPGSLNKRSSLAFHELRVPKEFVPFFRAEL